MIINLSGPVNDEMFDKLLEAYNSLADEDLVVYFTSEGGDIHVADAMIDFINTHKDEMYFVFYSNIYSSGFKIATQVKCSKEIMKNTIAMAHLGYSQGHTINELGKMDDISNAYLKRIKNEKNSLIKEYEDLGFTKQELRKLKNWEDIFFSLERFTEIFENSKEVNVEIVDTEETAKEFKLDLNNLTPTIIKENEE